MLERYLIEQCAPTLASLKTAALFRCPLIQGVNLNEEIASMNHLMRDKGLRLTLLLVKKNWALVYVYRPKRLYMDLNQDEVRILLEKYGYCTRENADVSQNSAIQMPENKTIDPEQAISDLMERLQESEQFPHEIGVFLGYPYADVIGFIRNHGENCICLGDWKVYDNAEEAVRLFDKYKKCRCIYTRLWSEGSRNLLELTVAA